MQRLWISSCSWVSSIALRHCWNLLAFTTLRKLVAEKFPWQQVSEIFQLQTKMLSIVDLIRWRWRMGGCGWGWRNRRNAKSLSDFIARLSTTSAQQPSTQFDDLSHLQRGSFGNAIRHTLASVNNGANDTDGCAKDQEMEANLAVFHRRWSL